MDSTSSRPRCSLSNIVGTSYNGILGCCNHMRTGLVGVHCQGLFLIGPGAPFRLHPLELLAGQTRCGSGTRSHDLGPYRLLRNRRSVYSTESFTVFYLVLYHGFTSSRAKPSIIGKWGLGAVRGT